MNRFPLASESFDPFLDAEPAWRCREFEKRRQPVADRAIGDLIDDLGDALADLAQSIKELQNDGGL